MSVHTVIKCDRCGFEYRAEGVVSLGCLYSWSTFAMDGQRDCCHSCLLALRDQGRAVALGGAPGVELHGAALVSDSTIGPSTIRCVSCGASAAHGIALRGEHFCEACGTLMERLNR